MTYNIQSLRDHLLDKERTLALADFYIKKAIEEVEEEEECKTDPGFLRYFSLALDTFVKQSIELIYAYAESKIERIFLNSLVLCFIKADPPQLVFTPPSSNAPLMMKRFRRNHRNSLAWLNIKNKFTSYERNWQGFEKFLDDSVTNGHMSLSQKEDLIHHIIFYHYLNWFNSFHLTMQAGFPDIRVDGKPIRADILIWIPGNEEFNLIVECDGYKFHSGKDSFVADRKRDRAFQLKGYTVLRYAGSEIFNDPIAVSSDLFKYLTAHSHKANP